MIVASRTHSSYEEIQHRLPTNTLSSSKRLHRWGNFIAGYSVEFVEQCLGVPPSEPAGFRVLDPFAGCGTTLLAARNKGFSTVGYELNPVFYFITDGKLKTHNVSDLKAVRDALLSEQLPMEWSADAWKFLTKLFSEENLTKIGSASAAVSQLDQSLKGLAVTIFLKACELACGAQTDGVYKAPTSKKKALSFASAVQTAYEEFEADISSTWYQNQWLHTVPTEVFNASATEMPGLAGGSIDFCITSPPYLNNFDYAEMTRMHLYLLGWCDSWRDISEKVRNNLITNTTTALKGKKGVDVQRAARESLPFELRDSLDGIVSQLTEQRSVRAGKKEYDYLVYLYYAQISKVLSLVYEALKSDGELHWVVADAALYGVHIETHEHTAQLLRSLGYRNVEVNFMRKRGHRWVLSKRDGAKKGLGEYHIKAQK